MQKGHVYDKRIRGYAFRYQFPPFPVPIPILPSTKIGLLCAFGLWEPSFQAVRAQKVGFCAFFAFGTPDFWLFEHKIGVFVLFLPLGPPFSGFSSTKSRFLCAFCLLILCFRAFRAQNRHFCVRNGDISLVLAPSEHKIGIFVRFCWEPDHRQREPGGWQREPDHRHRKPGGWQRVNGSLVPR